MPPEDDDFKFDGFDTNDPDAGIDFDKVLGDGAPDDGEKSDAPDVDAVKAELEAQKAANALLVQKFDKLLEARERFSTDLSDPPAPRPPSEADREALKQTLLKLQFEDPIEYARQMKEAAKNELRAEMEARFGNVAGSTTALEVQAFRSTAIAGDADTQAEFDAIVNQPATRAQLANLDPATRQQSLNMIADMAYGRAQRKRASAGARDHAPPSYGGGSSGGGSNVSTFRGKPLTDMQRAIVQTAREAGITDPKRIAAMLADE